MWFCDVFAIIFLILMYTQARSQNALFRQTMTGHCYTLYTLTSYDFAGGNNLLLARHEDEDVSHRWLEVYLNSLLHCTVHIILTVVTRVQNIHREGASRNIEHGHIAKERGELGRIHSGRSHDQLEIIPPWNNLTGGITISLISTTYVN